MRLGRLGRAISGIKSGAARLCKSMWRGRNIRILSNRLNSIAKNERDAQGNEPEFTDAYLEKTKKLATKVLSGNKSNSHVEFEKKIKPFTKRCTDIATTIRKERNVNSLSTRETQIAGVAKAVFPDFFTLGNTD